MMVYRLYTLDRIDSQYYEVMVLMRDWHPMTQRNLLAQNAVRLMAMDTLGIDEDRNEGHQVDFVEEVTR